MENDKALTQTEEQRFAQLVLKQLSNGLGKTEDLLNKDQVLLAQKYFFGIDRALRKAETDRAKSYNKQNNPEITWKTINVNGLVQDIADNVLAGIDPTLPNQINFIPYLNSKTGMYDMTQILGYVGYEIRHENQGLRKLEKVITKLVYSNEKFIPKYGNGVEGDSFEHMPSENPFERGELVGGYIFKQYANGNTDLKIVTKAEIDKRRPSHAAAEFWGGEKDEWVNKQKTGNKIQVQGWYDEMAYKTLRIMAFKSETLDGSKTLPRNSEFSNENEVTVDVSHEEVEEPKVIQSKRKATPKVESVEVEEVANTNEIKF